jgi:hypothetical protein
MVRSIISGGGRDDGCREIRGPVCRRGRGRARLLGIRGCAICASWCCCRGESKWKIRRGLEGRFAAWWVRKSAGEEGKASSEGVEGVEEEEEVEVDAAEGEDSRLWKSSWSFKGLRRKGSTTGKG